MTQNFKKTRVACYTGYVTQAIVVNLAPLLFVIFQDTYHFSLTYIAAITLVTFLVQIGIDLLSVKFIEKASYRVLSVWSQATCAVGLILLAFLPAILVPEAAVMASVIVYSAGSGLAEVVLSPLMEALPKDEDAGGSPMSLMHSFYSWGQAFVILVTTALLRVIGSEFWFFLPLLWALIPIFNSIFFAKVPMVEMTVHDGEHGAFSMLRDPVFIVAFLLMVFAGAAEQIMAQWASLFAERGLGITKIVGDLLGPCMFAVMMGIGRTAYGIWGHKLKISRALTACAALTVVCYLAAVFAPFPFVSLLACGVTGLGVSLMWPGMLALCADKYPGAGASMFAMMAVGGDIGCSLGPWLTGVVSDIAEELPVIRQIGTHLSLDAEQTGLRAGILAGVIFPILMVVGMGFLSKKKRIK
ncbi:MAG: MFS transporter [Clostridiales bacterium]|jgi:fucose permease|nr:MFS transporter [Clostridiales bacterium]